jgi:hypothetical protein
MNLKEHKQLVWEYERLLLELASLRGVKPDDEWAATTSGEFSIPLPADCAQKLLQEHLWGVEKKAKDMAAALGVTFEERA